MNLPTAGRGAVLRSFGAGERETDELLSYNENPFAASDGDGGPPPLPTRLPLADEPFLEAWADYAAGAAAAGGAWETLRRRLVQLRFPIAEGQSGTPEYRAATRRGVWPPEAAAGLELTRPEALALSLHPTAAGRLPILCTPHRRDFETLVQALARRGEPQPVPASMGACFVAGLNNWDRVARLRADWARREPDRAADEAAWQEEFARLQPRKALYQDTLMLLSGGPYSAVPAAALGLSDPEWERLSVAIRREHECAHYVTRRVFGSLTGRLYEELLADFAGLAAALGRYPAEWALRFLGLEDFPRYRVGGRLENYRARAPRPPLSDAAFALLGALVHRAAHHLAAAVRESGAGLGDARERTVWLLALSGLTLETLAAPGASARLIWARTETAAALRFEPAAN